MSAPLLTVPEVADRLRVNHDTVRRLAAQGRLRGSKPATAWRFDPRDVDDYINASMQTAAPPVVVRRRRRRAA